MAAMTKALVLGGGGVAGIAWEAGIITGLAREGVDLRDADILVGTSAGSVVSTLIATGVDLEEAISHQAATDLSAAPVVDSELVMTAFALRYDPTLPPVEARRKVGELAMSAPVAHEAERLAAIGNRLPVREWPDRRLLITAVDAESGDLVVWERDSGVPLTLAVASSCAVPCVFPPVPINGRYYIDGGVRSVTNADLAAGASSVVIIEPMGHLVPREPFQREIAALDTDDIALVNPDEAAIRVFGANILDPALWRPAFEAGLAQAPRVRDDVAKVWPPPR